MSTRIRNDQKVFGIGLSKTGTTSLNDALNLLGIPSIHFPHDAQTFDELARGEYRLSVLNEYQGVTDTPVAPFFAQLDKVWPNSKFILTTREKSSWLRSAEAHWRGLMVGRRLKDPQFGAYIDFISAAVYGCIYFNTNSSSPTEAGKDCHRVKFVWDGNGTNFAHAIVRPLDAEVLIDALCQATGTTQEYASAIPEPFTFTPLEQRAIALADGSITSAFLETFGRPPRDSGLATERTSTPTAAERLYMLNSTDVQRRLQQSPRLQAIFQGQVGGDGRDLVARLYRTILSRPPTEGERDDTRGRCGSKWGAENVVWALINSEEFLFRH